MSLRRHASPLAAHRLRRLALQGHSQITEVQEHNDRVLLLPRDLKSLGQALAKAFADRPACLTQPCEEKVKAIDELSKVKRHCRRYPRVPPNRQVAEEWAKTGEGMFVADEESGSEAGGEEEGGGSGGR